MGKVERFEDLEVWKRARAFDQVIYQLCAAGSLSEDFDLKRQLLKSSGSVMDNIAEGFERSGNREFRQFLYISKGSAGELRSQIYRAYDRKHIVEKEFTELKEEILSISNMISGLIRYLDQTVYKGTKYMSREPDVDYDGFLEESIHFEP